MDPKRHPNRKGLEQLSKKFKFDYFSTFPGMKRFIDGEIEKYLDKNLDCDDLWDEDGLAYPAMDVYEIHEDEWFDKLRRADRKFGDLCDFWIQTYMDGIEDSRKNREEAEDWLYEAVVEGFWAEFPESYVEEEFEDYFEEARQSCMEEEEERRDPYGYRGLSRRDFMASSQRNSLIRLAASLPAGDKSRRAILSGLRTRTASSLKSRLKPGSSHYVMVPNGVEYEAWSDNYGPIGVQDGADLFEVWENYERRPMGRSESEERFPIRAQVINSNGRRGKSFHLPDSPRIVVLSELDGMNPKDALREWYKLR